MYELDFSTTTPQDVIRRSIICHPSLFCERMSAVALVHNQARVSLSHHRDRDTASRLRDACQYVADFIAGADDTPEEMAAKIVLLGMDYWISSLDVAAKLQCIPFATVSDIVARYEAQREATAAK